MHSVGVDIIEIARVRRSIERYGERFLNRIFTVAELKLCRKHPERLASRFAGKEAVMKALGTGVRGVRWREIEILSENSGKPLVQLHGKTRDKAASLGLARLAISLSDSDHYAVAFVVGEVS